MEGFDRLESIKSRLRELACLDADRRVFGASSHGYALNPVRTEDEIEAFEGRHGIKLPEGYRAYLLRVGNGGAGPYYGLETLEDSLFVDLDFKRAGQLLDPSRPFPHTEAWNLSYEGDPEDEAGYEGFQEAYFADEWVNGLLRICNFGCGISMNLVVNGAEHGHIWVDDRGNGGGIYPDPHFDQTGRTTFLAWYELWLDRALEEARGGSV